MSKQDALNELRAENTALRSVIADAHALLDAAGIGEPAHNLAGRVAALIERAKQGLIYLACPYQHTDTQVMLDRFASVNRAAAHLMLGGRHVFSPISHTHPIAECAELPRGWEYWQAYDRLMLSFCSELVVLRLPGWEQSVGVRAEIAIAQELGIPTTYIDPED